MSSEGPRCVVCGIRDTSVGHLCSACHDALDCRAGLLPQQISSTAHSASGDVLIDAWGRAHALESRTLIGRAVEGPGILLLEATISRHHAHLTRSADEWLVRDLGSSNGTFVNSTRIDAQHVRHGDKIAFGAVVFYLACGVGDLPPVAFDDAVITEVRSTESEPPPEGGLPVVARVKTVREVDRLQPNAELPTVSLRIVEASSGNGGVIEVGDAVAALSTNQLRLLSLLVQRKLEDEHQPVHVRGFTRWSCLLDGMQYDVSRPHDERLKQLIRRTRRHLVRCGVGDLIEARQGFGYRLRVIPRTE